MKITLCSSATFFDKLYSIKKALEEKGHTILLPSMTDFHSLKGSEGESAFAKIHHNLIRGHFKKIKESDAIYVANYDKNGIKGYIGGNTLIEIGMAFDRKIPIFLMNEIPDDEIPDGVNYREEIVAMEPIIIGQDWDRLDKFLRKKD